MSAEPGAADDGWQVVEYSHSIASASAHDRKQLKEWAAHPGHWSGAGKHISSAEMKYKVHVDSWIGHGGHAVVEKVVLRSVNMARKRIRGSRKVPAERLREEANIMEKLCHRHIVELVGSYTVGRNELCLLTYPAATCDLHFFLGDVEDLRMGTGGKDANWDAGKRLELLGFKGLVAEGGNVDIKALDAPLRFLASILGCVTEAVEYVHANGVRHQDLKPRNILLGPRQVYLADFGISRDLKDATHSLTEGFPGGTPHYIAPEVAQGEAHHMSPADIYSLGCVFLVIASVLYGAPHSQYETVMSERDPGKKHANISKYLNELRSLAVKSGKAEHTAMTCMPKHLLGLIESMLSSDPRDRPTAKDVGATLYDLGGLSQLYHGPCCRKGTAYISELIDAKLANLSNAAQRQTALIEALEAQLQQQQAQITSLTETKDTYQARLEKENKHAVESYKTVLERKNRDLEAANAKIKALERDLERRAGGGGRRIPGGGAQELKAKEKEKDKGPRFSYAYNEHVGPTVSNNNNNDIHRLSPPQRRRSSKVPLPVRPSTPLRRSPQTSREAVPFSQPSSGTSTLVNSIASETSFAKSSTTSGGTVATSVSDGSVRSATPDPDLDLDAEADISVGAESPSGRKKGQELRASQKEGEEISHMTKPVSVPIKKTWAEMLRKQTGPTPTVTLVGAPGSGPGVGPRAGRSAIKT